MYHEVRGSGKYLRGNAKINVRKCKIYCAYKKIKNVLRGNAKVIAVQTSDLLGALYLSLNIYMLFALHVEAHSLISANQCLLCSYEKYWSKSVVLTLLYLHCKYNRGGKSNVTNFQCYICLTTQQKAVCFVQLTVGHAGDNNITTLCRFI